MGTIYDKSSLYTVLYTKQTGLAYKKEGNGEIAGQKNVNCRHFYTAQIT